MNDRFIKNTISLRGDAGKKWLDDIPAIIKKYETQWGLKVLLPFNLTYNYVAPAVRSDGSSAVLKIGFPDDKDIRTEIRALQTFHGEGSVNILESDLEKAVLLLEKIEPGDFLNTIKDDEKVIDIFAQVIKKLRKEEFNPTYFHSLTDWGRSFGRLRKIHNGTTGPFPKELFDKAENIFIEFTQEKTKQYLVHGDLHYENILLSQRGWLAIDPKGIVGDSVYETAMFLNDPYNDLPKGSDYKKLMQRRVDQLAEELQYDKQRIKNWAFVQAMLTAVWILEDHNEVSKLGIRNAELLSELCSW